MTPEERAEADRLYHAQYKRDRRLDPAKAEHDRAVQRSRRATPEYREAQRLYKAERRAGEPQRQQRAALSAALDMSWTMGAAAACLTRPDLDFFPVASLLGDGFPSNEPVTVAPPGTRTACASCPLLAPCREHAIIHERYGVWGGLTEAQRVELRRQRRIPLATDPPWRSTERISA